ncbi:MAG TPA: hypothetical protein QF646_05405 [Candidatus Poseidoniales archaeon]|nr:hypothetical protein [Candidatus Poseidoniales archaeon]
MARLGVITIISGIVMLGGLLSTIYFGVLLENTFVGKEGNVTLDAGQNYSVFLTKSDSNSEASELCSGVYVSINSGDGNMFRWKCENRDDKVYLGYVLPNSTGEFTVSSSSDITLQMHPMIETRQFAYVMLSEGICFLGLVGVILGVRSGK